jgi:hypothetical protein
MEVAPYAIVLQPEKVMSTTLLSMRQMKDYEVYDVEGRKLGKIDDVMLDERVARVRYAVLACDAGLHKKRFAVPLLALRLDTENECFVIGVGRESLERAKGFDAASPPTDPDPLFGARPEPRLHLSAGPPGA